MGQEQQKVKLPKNEVEERFAKMLDEVANPKKSADNKFTSSKYETLKDVLEIVKPAAKNNGFHIRQKVDTTYVGQFNNECKVVLCTSIVDTKTGENVITDVRPISMADPNPQKIGSQETYYRRYSLRTLFGLVAEDDDGNYAAGQTQTYSQNYQY